MQNKITSNFGLLRKSMNLLENTLPEKEYYFEFCVPPYSFEVENAEFRNFISFNDHNIVDQIRRIKLLNNKKMLFKHTNLTLPVNEDERYLWTKGTLLDNQIRFKFIHADFEEYCSLIDVQKYNVNGDNEFGLRLYGFSRGDRITFLYFDPHHLIATRNRLKYSYAKECKICISLI